MSNTHKTPSENTRVNLFVEDKFTLVTPDFTKSYESRLSDGTCRHGDISCAQLCRYTTCVNSETRSFRVAIEIDYDSAYPIYIFDYNY